MVVDLGLVSFALGVGAATFFSPCAVGLLPGYAAFFTGTEGSGAEDRSWVVSLGAGFRFGGLAALGAVLLFGVGALGVYVLRTRLGVLDSGGLLVGFSWLGLLVGFAFVVLGVAMLVDRYPRVSLPVRGPRERSGVAMVAFGGLFAAGSMGCTLPLFLGVLGAALGQGPLGSVLVLSAYGVGLSGLLLATGVGLTVAKDQVERWLRGVKPYVRPVSGVLLLAAGVYVVGWYVVYGF